ncbi:glycoside hydrolase family 125 protein [Flavicella sp.]|uniref:glycoside hydrolase family 125 protein n=1 Tax=Flavicella sp. TaxID=2957742 RepID=UPI003018832D
MEKSRRNFIKKAATLGLVANISPLLTFANKFADKYPSNRPIESQRTFVSKAVEHKIKSVSSLIYDHKLAWMFSNCYPNTLDTTVMKHNSDEKNLDTYIITGDIDAMWLRDSTAQVWPYLPLTGKDKALKNIIKGLINRQLTYVLADPYTNAFLEKEAYSYWRTKDNTQNMDNEIIHERKWEIDSLCYVVRLIDGYYKHTKDTSVFDEKWDSAMRLIVKTFREQQRKHNNGPYSFTRETDNSIESCPGFGWGNPIIPNGLICSNFRPSDDATNLLFLIPSNYFAATSLGQMSEQYKTIYKNKEMSEKCLSFSEEVKNALNQESKFIHPKTKKEIIAYEVDGFGNSLFMDDANIPSLLSLPYLGCLSKNDPIYKNTREFILSKYNPYFEKYGLLEGGGSPHTGKGKFWPMSVTIRALTSSDKEEIRKCLKILVNSDDGTGFMHEAVSISNPKYFTRSWFAWANTLFGELIINVGNKYPELLKENYVQ